MLPLTTNTSESVFPYSVNISFFQHRLIDESVFASLSKRLETPGCGHACREALDGVGSKIVLWFESVRS